MKILYWDVETAPLLSRVWSRYEANSIYVEEDWYMLSFAYKWDHEKKAHCKSLIDYPLYKKDPENDLELIKDLWKLLDEASVVIHHNGDRFDLKKANSKIIQHGLRPYSPLKTIDTLKEARKHFSFSSNRLNDLGEILGLGGKFEHSGYSMWKGCLEGDMKAWESMIKYNKRDVILLEDVYKALRPWTTSTNLGLQVDDGELKCPKCGSDKIQKRGFSYSNSGKYQRFQCCSCGGWSRGRTKEKGSGNPLTH